MSALPLPGIDLVEIPRIRRAIERHGEAFLGRVYTEAEIGYCQAHGDPMPSFAARWAAKEAVAKALGTGIGPCAALKEIEVVKLTSGQPTIQLHGAAAATAARLGVRAVRLSLTHTGSAAAAMVILC